MPSYKSYYLDDYKRNAADWPTLVKRPLFNQDDWGRSVPLELADEIEWSIKLIMGEAPVELIQACMQRARDIRDAVERADLLNTDQRHAQSEVSKISFLRGKILLNLLDGVQPASADWHNLALLHLQLFNALKESRTPAPDEKFNAILYFMLAHEYEEANNVIDGMRGARGYETELNVMKKLVPEMALYGGEVHDPEARDLVMDFFEQIREPEGKRNEKGIKFDKYPLDMFEWALFIAKFIDPGDGRLDTKRALDMVSR